MTLQKFLVAYGFLNATPTGYFGPATKAAVIAFQAKYAIVYTAAQGAGLVGTKTKNLINQMITSGTGKVTTAPNTTTPAQPTTALVSVTTFLYPGLSGAQVRNLQLFLVSQGFLSSASATGYYGALTTAGVTAFQKKNGIVTGGTAETTGLGLVGTKTMNAINQIVLK